MSVLANPQWEIYARELVEIELACVDENMTASRGDLRHQAYKKAGYSGNADNARRLANQRQVKARFRQLFAEALEYRDVRAATVVTRIDRVGRANVADFYELAEDGQSLKLRCIKSLPRELSEAIKAVKVNDDGSMTVELWDKNQANFTLLKHLGGLPDDHASHQTNIGLMSVLNVDDQRTLIEALKALPAGAPGGDSGAREERREP